MKSTDLSVLDLGKVRMPPSWPPRSHPQVHVLGRILTPHTKMWVWNPALALLKLCDCRQVSSSLRVLDFSSLQSLCCLKIKWPHMRKKLALCVAHGRQSVKVLSIWIYREKTFSAIFIKYSTRCTFFNGLFKNLILNIPF